MHEEKLEAIVLRSQDYQERHRIVTLFSASGLMTVMVKNISKKNTRLLSLSSVFTQGEYLLSQGNSSFFRFIDGTLIDEHLSLRKQYSSIQAAAHLTQSILSTQLPGKATPELFSLYKSYLKQVPTFPNLTSLTSSFQLKLLKQEGFLSLTPTCAHCSGVPACLIDQGESFCASHHPSAPHRFTTVEWEHLHLLYGAKNFSTLRLLKLEPLLSSKIETLFRTRFSD